MIPVLQLLKKGEEGMKRREEKAAAMAVDGWPTAKMGERRSSAAGSPK